MQELIQKLQKTLFVAFIFLLTIPSFAQERFRSYSIEKSNDWICKVYQGPGEVRHYILRNGLSVIFSKNTKKPTIQTRIAVKAGSKNDPAENTGLAHYLEHMLFKGTDKYGTLNYNEEKKYLKQIEDLYEVYNKTTNEVKRKKIYAQIDSISGKASQYSIANEYDKMVQAIGATGTNAYTSVEQTVYVNTIPNNEIHRWLEIESERFRNPVMRLFHTELEAVYEEKNISMDNDMSQVFETLNASLFKNHNYGQQTTIGTVEHLKNPSLVAINNYYYKNYVPNNMAIIMTGDFGYDSTIKMITKHFSYMKKKPVEEYKFKLEYPSTQPKEYTIVGKTAPSVWLGFRLPGFGNKEAMMAELVDMLLNNSNAGLFDLNLVKAQKVLRAGSFVNTMKDYSVHMLYGNPKANQDLSKVKDLMLAELEKIKNGQFSDTLLQSIILDYEINKMKSNESAGAMVNELTSAFIYDIDWMEYSNRLYYQSTFTKEDIVKFAKEFYTNDFTIIYKEQGEPSKKPQIEKPQITPVKLNRDKTSNFVQDLMNEESGQIEPVFVDINKAIKFSSIKSAPFWYVQNTDNQLFTLYYTFDIGKYHNKLLPLAVNFIEYLGAGSMSANKLSEAMYQLGSSFSVSSGTEESYVYLSGIQKNFEESLKLFEQLLTNPQNNESAFKSMIADIKTQRINNKSNKRAIAEALRSFALYGKDNPFNYQLSSEELDNLSSTKLMEIIKDLMNYKHTIMYYGPEEMKSVEEKVANIHGIASDWKAIPTKKAFTPLVNKNTTVFFAQYDNMVQAQINWIKRSEKFDINQMAIADLHSNYFGGGMSGVVFQTIRESKSLAYSSYSSYRTANKKDKYNQVFSFVGTQSDKMKDAIIAMNELHNNLPIAEQNYERAKAAALSQIRTARTYGSGLFWYKRSLEEMGLNKEYQSEKMENVKQTTFAEMQEFHKNAYGKSPFNYAILGDKSKLDMNYLNSLGKFEEIDLVTLFGY